MFSIDVRGPPFLPASADGRRTRAITRRHAPRIDDAHGHALLRVCRAAEWPCQQPLEPPDKPLILKTPRTQRTRFIVGTFSLHTFTQFLPTPPPQSFNNIPGSPPVSLPKPPILYPPPSQFCRLYAGPRLLARTAHLSWALTVPAQPLLRCCLLSCCWFCHAFLLPSVVFAHCAVARLPSLRQLPFLAFAGRAIQRRTTTTLPRASIAASHRLPSRHPRPRYIHTFSPRIPSACNTHTYHLTCPHTLPINVSLFASRCASPGSGHLPAWRRGGARRRGFERIRGRIPDER